MNRRFDHLSFDEHAEIIDSTRAANPDIPQCVYRFRHALSVTRVEIEGTESQRYLFSLGEFEIRVHAKPARSRLDLSRGEQEVCWRWQKAPFRLTIHAL